jgi:hypothetical protein
MPTLLSAMTRLFWISRDANGYRWQPLTTGCAMQQQVRELHFSACHLFNLPPQLFPMAFKIRACPTANFMT